MPSHNTPAKIRQLASLGRGPLGGEVLALLEDGTLWSIVYLKHPEDVEQAAFVWRQIEVIPADRNPDQKVFRLPAPGTDR